MITNEDQEVNEYNPNLVNSSTQTVIRVHPFIFDGNNEYAEVKSDKKVQTALNVSHDLNSSKFYSLLRYTPFQDIRENSLRVFEIPRSRRLQFSSLAQNDNLDQKAVNFTLEDDDGVGYVCTEILRRLRNRVSKAYVDAEAQTDVRVSPQLLDSQAVATVICDADVQTGKC